MKFLTISGPRSSIDRVCEQYLSKYEIQLENAISELKTTKNLMPFVEVNPYRDSLEKANRFALLLPEEEYHADLTMSKEAMINLMRELNHDYLEIVEKQEHLKQKRDELAAQRNVLEPFCALDVEIQKVQRYQHMKVRFGRVLTDYYQRLQKYLYQDLKAVFVEGNRTEKFVYGCYFVANADVAKTDAAFDSLHFEQIEIPAGYVGTPAQACNQLRESIKEAEAELKRCEEEITGLMRSHASQIIGTRARLEEMANNFDIRKKAARMSDEQEDSFILCGWMSEQDIESLLADTKEDNQLLVMVDDNEEHYFGEPPTKIKNPKIFKPFELFVRMYGVPNHDELDPTVFVALTYVLIFGAMFGDMGQGLCLFLIGGLVCLRKKNSLAGIISVAGLSSMFFGFMFGSVFGFENIIQARWLRPVEAMSDLPFIGQLNTVFVVAVAFGMGMNLLVMLFCIANAIKSHETGKLLFSQNGLAGLVFYGFLVLTIVLYMTGRKTPGNIMLAIFLGVPILLFLFREPLTNLVEKRHEKSEGGKVMFLVEGFFELFETMLSYFSNTVSFVRIGAFAVSHAAMMNVVLMLSGAESGHINWVGIVFGNALVCLLEGLIVGIQVLRLEYYEMFSRFYKGGGREFKPFQNKIKE